MAAAAPSADATTPAGAPRRRALIRVLLPPALLLLPLLLLTLLPPEISLQDSFVAADEVARQAIVGVASLVGSSQLINVDLADVRSVMQRAGRGVISLGRDPT